MKVALIVGIDHYQYGPLHGCVEDAESIARVLARHYDGSPNFEVISLLSSKGSITRPALRENIDRLLSGSFDVALFYFAGHGTINGAGGCIVTQDTTRYDEGISMAEILGQANRSASREVIIILDCCHSGAFGALAAINSPHAHLREGVSVLCASRSTESAVEVDGRGVFTGLVVEALHGGASDLLGRTTMADVFAFVDRHLGPWQQRPMFKCHVSQLVPLRSSNPRIGVSSLHRLTEIFVTADSEYPLDVSYEYQSDHDASDRVRAEMHNTLRIFRSVGLVSATSEKDLYHVAMEGGSCRLTKLGQYYWHLVKQQRI